MRRRLATCGVLASFIGPAAATAADEVDPRPSAAPTTTATLPPGADIEFAPEPPGAKPPDAPSDMSPTSTSDAPPPRPSRSGLVLESTLGVLGFVGQFRHVAPPAYWFHAQLGYEVLPWLMLFGEGELAFTDDGESQDASHTMAFPLYGFGAGGRATLHTSSRVAVFGQGELDAMAAKVPHSSLGNLGFRNAETLAPSFGVRFGGEWYQVDRHLALSAQLGGRYASGFAKQSFARLATTDTPIMWDAALGLRYTF